MNVSSFGRRLLAAANGTFAGTIIGLGTAAFKNTGTSGNTVSLLDGANTWSAIQTFSANPSVTGGAISFPATQVPSAGANDLDDYEEGTFTPVLTINASPTGITYSVQTGAYTKIGRLVIVVGRITLSNKGASVGSVVITGLPFTPTASQTFPLVFPYYTNLASITGILSGYLASTSIIIVIGGTSSMATATNSNLTNTSDLLFNFSYWV